MNTSHHMSPRLQLCSRWRPLGTIPGLTITKRRVAIVPAAQEGDKGSSFGDELLDFMYAGKKLRKWYGEEGMVLPRDGGGRPGEGEPEEPEEPDLPRDQILVLDADSAMGEQVVLQLILARAKIKALVKDAAAAAAGFGPYLQAVQGSEGDARALARALRGVRAVVCCGRLGALLPAAKAAGVQHLVLLSTVGAPRRGLALFGGGEQAVLADAEREQQALRCGVPCTVVRVGGLADVPGGVAGIAVEASSGSSGAAGEISREDAACVLARAAAAEPAGAAVVVTARNVPAGGAASDWEAALDSALQSQVA